MSASQQVPENSRMVGCIASNAFPHPVVLSGGQDQASRDLVIFETTDGALILKDIVVLDDHQTLRITQRGYDWAHAR